MKCIGHAGRVGAGAVLVTLASALCVAGPLMAQEGFRLSEVSFLSGCWAGQMGTLDRQDSGRRRPVERCWARPATSAAA